ncbi:MAG: hydrogenase maturation nickel metallochaperone HypA [Candidatus Aenigmatarchaeota archaeon]|nr:MAG: hydrogenase maturation nickel metallochaperone HypA [Candidatus Aenigmarchaeota archaeon]
MEFRDIREEKAVDSLLHTLKEGNYKKATLKLGELRGRPEEFMKLFEYITHESRLQDLKLKIKTVKARVRCLSCDWKGDPEIVRNGVRCPRCRSDVKVLRGHEFHFEL